MKTNSKQIIITSILVALFAILSITLSINLHDIKLTLQNLPIYYGAIVFGPACGGIIGFVGMLINQIITYGFTATTIFWIIPHGLIGIFTGVIFAKYKDHLDNNKIAYIITIIILQILLTILNTFVLTLDAILYGYYNFFLIFAMVIPRMMLGILIGIIYGIILPIIIKATKKIH